MLEPLDEPSPDVFPGESPAARGEGIEVRALERPSSKLLTYYTLFSLLFGPFFPIAFGYFYFRYRTLRYHFDDEGVSMRWGALFRREISLTYARIQDIHLVSNFVERRLGLAGERTSRWRKALGVFVTFHVVCLAWVFFRAPSFAGAGEMLLQLGRGGWDAAPNLNRTILAVLALGFVEQALPDDWGQRVYAHFVRAPALAQAAVLVAVLRLVGAIGQGGSSPFIYFQF